MTLDRILQVRARRGPPHNPQASMQRLQLGLALPRQMSIDLLAVFGQISLGVARALPGTLSLGLIGIVLLLQTLHVLQRSRLVRRRRTPLPARLTVTLLIAGTIAEKRRLSE